MRLLHDPLREEIGSPSGDSFLGRKTGLQLLPSPTHPPRAASLRTNEDRLYKVLGGSRGSPSVTCYFSHAQVSGRFTGQGGRDEPPGSCRSPERQLGTLGVDSLVPGTALW